MNEHFLVFVCMVGGFSVSSLAAYALMRLEIWAALRLSEREERDSAADRWDADQWQAALLELRKRWECGREGRAFLERRPR